MTIKERKYSLSLHLLRSFVDASLLNASELLFEASDFLSQKKYARAYFLACASLEETGKAYLAFSALGRNIKNSDVESEIKASFERHRSKITSALICSLEKDEVAKENASKVVELLVDLENGREKSMYVDINDVGEVTIPSEIVKPKVAANALELAKLCFRTTGEFIQKNEPKKLTDIQDKLICIKTQKLVEILSDSDFLEFVRSRNWEDFRETCVKYNAEYTSKGKKFKVEFE
jgi:AbiV family abortive infection protein